MGGFILGQLMMRHLDGCAPKQPLAHLKQFRNSSTAAREGSPPCVVGRLVELPTPGYQLHRAA